MVTELDDIFDALSEERLFDRAVNDAIVALMRRATLNRSLHDAVTQLERWRRIFEEGARP